MNKIFKNGSRVYIPILEPIGLPTDKGQMVGILSVPTRRFGVELIENSVNNIKLFFNNEEFIVPAFDLIDAINEALTIQRNHR